MMKKLLLFVLIIFICSSMGNNYNVFKFDDDEILWSSKRKLIWDDFKGAVPETREPFVDAVTCYSIQVHYEYLDDVILNYKIENYFIKSNSWTITSDIQTLAHEQLHFDIAELFARKIIFNFII